MNKFKPGSVFPINGGGECVIISYGGCYEIEIEHLDAHKHRAIVTTSQLKRGSIKNPYAPKVYGVGYVGVGDALPSRNGKDTKEYSTWIHMLERCYSEKKQLECPSYTGCSVAAEWHNFQTFYAWYLSQPYGGIGYQIDKDILNPGNKVYCPEFCRLVPDFVNKVLGKNERKRGSLPMGMQYHSGAYTVKLSAFGKIRYIGRFKDEISAFLAYKEAREEYIREVADMYKSTMPEDVYGALISHEININD